MLVQSKIYVRNLRGTIILFSAIMLFTHSFAYGWHDKTHLAVAQVVGLFRAKWLGLADWL